ncbi:hypothetical protein [uncultured Kordia sp.]|nr:hypothetical protein [uncultured Kordia sp.]
MKKNSIKTLKLNKTAVCNLEDIKGGMQDEDCTCDCCTCKSNCCN